MSNNTNIQIKRTLEIGLLVVLVLFVVFPKKVFAENISTGIYPPILQIETTPPASVKAGISIENKSDQTIVYNIFLIPFKDSGKGNGEPVFDKELLGMYKNLFDKIQIWDADHSVNQITLAPKQKKNLTLHLGIQKGERPQDYYFSVLFVTTPLDDKVKDSGPSSQGGIATNVLLSIGPKAPTSGEISEFWVPSFLTHGPVNFKLNVSNTGKSYLTATGTILVKNIFGQTIGQIETIPANVLLDSNRFLSSKNNPDPNHPRVVWNEKFLLGIYTADATVKLSDQGPILHKSLTFLAFPVEGVLGILIAVGIAIGIIKRVKAKQKISS